MAPDAGRATLSAAVTHWATTRPTAPAVRCGDDAMTRAQLDVAMTRLGYRLFARGVSAGDRVVLLGENSLEWVIAFLGCQRARIVVVPMNTRLAPGQIVAQTGLVGAKVVLHDEKFTQPDLPASTGAECIELTGLVRSCTDMPAPPDERSASEVVGADDAALISFTSGTTGTPKGATVSSRALATFAHAFARYFRTGPDDSTLVFVPIFHNTGFADQLGHMIAAGGTTTLLRRYRTDDAVAELIARPATFLAAVPSMLRMLMLHRDADAVFREVRTIMFGGSAIPAAWVDELLRRWPHLELAHAYGLSEFTSVCTILPSELASTKAESAGVPLPGVDLRVVDDQGVDVPPGESGEVWVAGPTRMIGYWNEPGLTASKLVGRWLRTGDLGHVDADGLLWLHGRVDDVINRGGEKIMPTFVESQIARHESVAAACAFGYPDEILRQRVAAAVEVRPGTDFSEADLRDFLRDVLPDYAIPDRWVVYEQLPLNASGKFDRPALSANLLAAQSES